MHVRFSFSIAAPGCALSATALADLHADFVVVKGGIGGGMPGRRR